MGKSKINEVRMGEIIKAGECFKPSGWFGW
jgi:hypothetical protein